jgi:hypothetical protein
MNISNLTALPIAFVKRLYIYLGRLYPFLTASLLLLHIFLFLAWVKD